MAYIGRGIENFSQIEVLDLITFTNSAGPYNITKDSVAFVPSTVNSLLIEVDGIIQAPASYTISGSTITFGASMASTSTMNSMIHFGTGLITTPADGSVTAAKIASDAVTTAKILDNNVTVAKLPTTLDISGNTVTLPASVSGLGTGITNAQLAGSIDVTSKITGVVPSANLGSGTGSSANFLRGDSSWQEVATGTSWQSVVTASTLTAVAGRGYPINTTSNACTVTLPAGSVGDTIELVDYAGTWDTNKVTLTANGSEKIKGSTDDKVLISERQGIKLVYVDATQGWVATTGVNEGTAPALDPPSYNVDFLCIAGGGAAGDKWHAGGGGAGGYRNSYNSEASGGGGSSETALTFNGGTVYTITVGAGGPGAADGDNASGNPGTNSSISGADITTITSIGGGYGGGYANDGGTGGSGGGGGGLSGTGTSGAGTSNQGYAGGGNNVSNGSGGGGGGASEVGETTTSDYTGTGGDGGDGLASSITGSSVTRGGGGAGGATTCGAAGSGGGGGDAADGTDGLGGGGGAPSTAPGYGGDGGNGVVILRMADGSAGTPSGEDSVATDVGGSGETVITWLATGSYTA